LALTGWLQHPIVLSLLLAVVLHGRVCLSGQIPVGLKARGRVMLMMTLQTYQN
jgi:hypothetical protein